MSEDVDRVMFVYATLELPVTVASAIDRMDRVMASQRLDDLSDQAYEKGLVTLARVGPFGAVRGLSKAVRLQMLEPRPIDSGVRVQLRWVATGATGQLYPTLDADLDITGVDERRCALSVNAVYTPPLGAAGASIDRLLLHLAARATIRSLLRGLGHSLSYPSPAVAHASRPRLGRIRFAPPATGRAIPQG
jgi:hypothetical protein